MAIAFRELEQASTTDGSAPSVTFADIVSGDVILMAISAIEEASTETEDGNNNASTPVIFVDNGGDIAVGVTAFLYAGGSKVFRGANGGTSSFGISMGAIAISGLDVSNFAGLSFVGTTGVGIASATGSSTNPNPPSVNMTADNWSLIAAGSNNTDAAKTLPTGYTNEVDVAADSTGVDVALGMGTKLITATGAENPATFGSWATGDWVAITIELKAATAKIPIFMHHYKLMASA